MTAALLGILLGFVIGVGCRWFDIPLPSPPNMIGALLVVAMTFGFLAADHFLTSTP
ncbi:MAG: DUF1427 family protein [Alphaproteobacteria bacterium]